MPRRWPRGVVSWIRRWATARPEVHVVVTVFPAGGNLDSSRTTEIIPTAVRKARLPDDGDVVVQIKPPPPARPAFVRLDPTACTSGPSVLAILDAGAAAALDWRRPPRPPTIRNPVPAQRRRQ